MVVEDKLNLNTRIKRISRQQAEMKYFDVNGAFNLGSTTDWSGSLKVPGGTGSPGILFAPIQGDHIFDRQGQETKVYKIRMRWNVTILQQSLPLTLTAGDNATTVRCIVFYDKESFKAQPDPTQVMQPSATAGNAINAFRNINFLSRYVVLMDKWVDISNPNFVAGTTNIVQQGIKKSFKWSHNFKNNPLVVKYDSGNTGTFADTTMNGLYCICQASNLDLVPVLNYDFRTCFKDI